MWVVSLPRQQGRQARDPLRDPAELEFAVFRGLAPVVVHALIEDMRAKLALDKLEGASAPPLLPGEVLTAGIPARFALHRQILNRGDVLDKFRHHLLEVEDDRV